MRDLGERSQKLRVLAGLEDVRLHERAYPEIGRDGHAAFLLAHVVVIRTDLSYRAHPGRPVLSPASSVLDVHGEDLLVQSGGVRLVPVVQLPDGDHPVASGLQAVSPAGDLADIRGRVVPVARLARAGTHMGQYV